MGKNQADEYINKGAAEFNNKNDSIGKKIREIEMQKVPYLLVVGDREAEANSVSIRHRGDKASLSKPLSEFISDLSADIIAKV